LKRSKLIAIEKLLTMSTAETRTLNNSSCLKCSIFSTHMWTSEYLSWNSATAKCSQLYTVTNRKSSGRNSCKCTKQRTKSATFFVVWIIHAHSSILNLLIGEFITSFFTEILLNHTNKAEYEVGVTTNTKDCNFTPKCMHTDKFEYHIKFSFFDSMIVRWLNTCCPTLVTDTYTPTNSGLIMIELGKLATRKLNLICKFQTYILNRLRD